VGTNEVTYTHYPEHCVAGFNGVNHGIRTLCECQELCEADSSCQGFEYGVNHGGADTNYPDGVCQMSTQRYTASIPASCNASHYNLDFYEPMPAQMMPNDPEFGKLWGMHSASNAGDIDAPEAWDMYTGSGGSDIIVAVIDTGIDYNHEDLQNRMWVNPFEILNNGIDDDGNAGSTTCMASTWSVMMATPWMTTLTALTAQAPLLLQVTTALELQVLHCRVCA